MLLYFEFLLCEGRCRNHSPDTEGKRVENGGGMDGADRRRHWR